MVEDESVAIRATLQPRPSHRVEHVHVGVWCASCVNHGATGSAVLYEAARELVRLGNQPGLDDDEWEAAFTALEEALR